MSACIDTVDENGVAPLWREFLETQQGDLEWLIQSL